MTRRILIVFALAAALFAGVVPAGAAPSMSRIVSENPADWTPHIKDGAVWAMTVVGDTVIVGGTSPRPRRAVAAASTTAGT